MSIRIESGVPIPSREFYEELTKMQVGDSFVFPQKKYSNLRSCLQVVMKENPERVFKTRGIHKDQRRIWRKE